MANEIISYIEMSSREKTSLQRGMNYRLHSDYSVLLMSVRDGAPFEDRIEDGGATVIYEGHNVNRTAQCLDPNLVDQPHFLPGGKLTENGKFYEAARRYKAGVCGAEKVRIYEKIKPGIWSYNGLFLLTNTWIGTEKRKVFKFRLETTDNVDAVLLGDQELGVPNRVIPSHVKQEVWRRDGGKCVICDLKDNLHFDHIIPYVKGGSSLVADNVQLLCARHNLKKGAKLL